MSLPNSFVGEKVGKVLESIGKVCIFAAKGCENGLHLSNSNRFDCILASLR